jgi:hypothetical protein
MSATEGASCADFGQISARDRPIGQILFASLFLAFALAAFLLIRRAAGAINQPLPFWPLAATAVAVIMWVWCVRFVYAQVAESRPVFSHHIDRLLATWLPLLTLASIAVACSYPGRRVVDWLVWLPVIVASAAAPRLTAKRRQQPRLPVIPSLSAGDPIEESGTLLQQLIRTRDANGCEVVHGKLAAEFVAGQRTTIVHVGFCPPFERLPQVEAEVVDGPDASVQVAQMLHNGARLEVRLPEAAAEAVNVSLEIVAHESAR